MKYYYKNNNFMFFCLRPPVKLYTIKQIGKTKYITLAVRR